MKRVYGRASRIIMGLAMVVATLSVNVTCNRRYYQGELGDQLQELRKYRK